MLPAEGLSRTLRRTAGVILGIVLLILVFQNTEVVSVRLLFWNVRMSLALLVLIVASISAVATLLAAKWLTVRRRRDPR